MAVDVPMLPIVPAAVIRSNSRMRKRLKSINGCRTRPSTTMNTTTPITPAAMRPRVDADVHPRSDARSTA